jgi:hypothetical protein
MRKNLAFVIYNYLRLEVAEKSDNGLKIEKKKTEICIVIKKRYEKMLIYFYVKNNILFLQLYPLRLKLYLYSSIIDLIHIWRNPQFVECF